MSKLCLSHVHKLHFWVEYFQFQLCYIEWFILNSPKSDVSLNAQNKTEAVKWNISVTGANQRSIPVSKIKQRPASGTSLWQGTTNGTSLWALYERSWWSAYFPSIICNNHMRLYWFSINASKSVLKIIQIMICGNIFTYFITSEALFHSSFYSELYWAFISKHICHVSLLVICHCPLRTYMSVVHY